MSTQRTKQISAISAISDPQRRALYEFVRRSGAPVSREDAAADAGIPRSTAAFHLDRLVDEGLLEAQFKRLGDKPGPGSGRPSKLYSPAPGEISVSLPSRHYELAGELLAAAVEESDRNGVPVRDALSQIAENTGRELGEQAGSLDAALESCGYEPQDDGAGGMVLTNCPFHRLATKHTEVICHANLGLLQGVADGAADTAHTVEFVPATDGRCCVRIAGQQAVDH